VGDLRERCEKDPEILKPQPYGSEKRSQVANATL